MTQFSLQTSRWLPARFQLYQFRVLRLIELGLSLSYTRADWIRYARAGRSIYAPCILTNHRESKIWFPILHLIFWGRTRCLSPIFIEGLVQAMEKVLAPSGYIALNKEFDKVFLICIFNIFHAIVSAFFIVDRLGIVRFKLYYFFWSDPILHGHASSP